MPAGRFGVCLFGRAAACPGAVISIQTVFEKDQRGAMAMTRYEIHGNEVRLYFDEMPSEELREK